MFKLFVPNRTSIWIKIVLLNAILLTGSFIGVEIYQHNATIVEADQQYTPISDTFWDNEYQTYWISQNRLDTKQIQTDSEFDSYSERLEGIYLSKMDTTTNQLQFQEILRYWTDNYHDSPTNRTSLEFQPFPVSDQYIGIWIEETKEIMYLNQSVTNTSFTVNGYPTQYVRDYYSLIFDRNQVDQGPTYVLKISLPKPYEIDDFHYEAGKYGFIIDNATTLHNSKFEKNHSKSLTQSQTFGQKLLDKAQTHTIGVNQWPEEQNIRNGTSYFEGIDIPTFDLADHIYNVEQIQNLTELPSIGMYKAEIEMIDKQGRMHIIGDSYYSFSDNSEGNFTGYNEPDYLLFNPDTNKMYYWDLFPSTNTHGGVLPYRIVLNLFNSSTVVVTFIAPSVTDFYQNTTMWNYDTDFSNEYFFDWHQTDILQVGMFNPENPLPNNYIQFNKSISQSEEASISYPRLTEIVEIHGTDRQYQGTLRRSNQFQVQIGQDINLYALLYDLDGQYHQPIENLGKSLVKIQISDSLTVQSFETLLKPEPKRTINATANDPFDDMDHNDFKGFHVANIYHIMEREGKQDYIFLSTTYSGSRILTQDTQRIKHYTMHVMEVNE